MTPEELKVLRSEAASFLDSLQALPGFAERRDDLPEVPESAHSLPFWSLRRLAHSDNSGKVVWRRWFSDEEAPDPDSILRLQEAKKLGYPVRVDFDDGVTMWRLPEYVVLTESEIRDELESYREAIDRFAKRVLLNAQWAASAVHDALIAGLPIALPAAPLSFEAPIVLEPGDVWPRSQLRALGESLLTIGASPGQEELPSRRDAVWQGALKALASELASTPMTGTERSNRSRARKLLDGAVNGRF